MPAVIEERVTTRRELLTVRLHNGDYLQFSEPVSPTKTTWFWLDAGILSVLESVSPRRCRCYPLANVDWWEYDQ